MRKWVFAIVVCCLAALNVLPAQGAITIDFEATALRAANDGVSGYAPYSELSGGNGMWSNTVAGQKAAYSTSYFNGWSLGSLDSITYTYTNKYANGAYPYVNMALYRTETDGSTSYCVLNNPNNYLHPDVAGGVQVTIDFTGTTWMVGQYVSTSANPYLVPDGKGGYKSGRYLLDKLDGDGWLLLDGERGLATNETSTNLLASETDALTILWGDSGAGKVGEQTFFDITVRTDRGDYVAGNVSGAVPEPASCIVWAVLSGVGYCVARRKRIAR